MSVVIYSRQGCSKCQDLKSFLNILDIDFSEIDLDSNIDKAEVLREKGFRQLPVVNFNESWISDIEELKNEIKYKVGLINKLKNLVIEFYKSFNQTVFIGQTKISEDRYNLKMRLYEEELLELNYALENYDLLESFDALADIMYIYIGNNLENVSELFDKDPIKIYEDYINIKTLIDSTFNIEIEDLDFLAIFYEVHKSNMSKLDEKGNPVYREDGKIIKSNLFFKPNIKKMKEYKKYLI